MTPASQLSASAPHDSVHTPPGVERGLQQAAILGIATVLVCGPLAFGAVYEWGRLGLRLAASILFLLWATRQMCAGRVAIKRNWAYLPVAAFGVIVSAQIALDTSAYRQATLTEALNWAAYAAILFVVMQTLQSEQDILKFCRVVVLFGFLLAVFAIVQDFTSEGKIYWIKEPRQKAWIFGPYVNHSNYAGLMEMLTAFPLVLVFTRMNIALRVLLLFVTAVMGGSIFLSGSRGGMVAFLVQIFTLAVILFALEKFRRSGVLLVLLVVVGLTVVIWLGGDVVGQRISNMEAPHRLQIALDSIDMVRDRPLLGWGLGNFRVVYPQFRTYFSTKTTNAAHNDYIQLLVETGLLGFVAALGFVGIIYWNGLRRLRNWTTDVRQTSRLAAVISCTGIVVHSLFDFNLQIPANAAVFFIIAALAVRGPSRGRDASSDRPRLRVR